MGSRVTKDLDGRWEERDHHMTMIYGQSSDDGRWSEAIVKIATATLTGFVLISLGDDRADGAGNLNRAQVALMVKAVAIAAAKAKIRDMGDAPSLRARTMVTVTVDACCGHLLDLWQADSCVGLLGTRLHGLLRAVRQASALGRDAS